MTQQSWLCGFCFALLPCCFEMRFPLYQLLAKGSPSWSVFDALVLLSLHTTIKLLQCLGPCEQQPLS